MGKQYSKLPFTSWISHLYSVFLLVLPTHSIDKLLASYWLLILLVSTTFNQQIICFILTFLISFSKKKYAAILISTRFCCFQPIYSTILATNHQLRYAALEPRTSRKLRKLWETFPSETAPSPASPPIIWRSKIQPEPRRLTSAMMPWGGWFKPWTHKKTWGVACKDLMCVYIYIHIYVYTNKFIQNGVYITCDKMLYIYTHIFPHSVPSPKE